MRTQVGIVGAGPAGLMLSHLLHQRGVESVVVDIQTRDTIEQTIKAGILEQGTVDLMRQTGVGDRMMRDGFVHHGINLAFEGGLHRIDLTELSGGRSVMVYAQHEVLKDLIAKRLDDGGDVRFGVSDTAVDGIETEQPTISFTHEGRQETLECDFVIGADGSRTMCRYLIPERQGLLPAVPVRLVRDPRRGAALDRRADLRALRAGVRAGVDPLAVGAAAVLPVRPRDERRRLVRRPDLVGVLRAAGARPGRRSRRARSSRRTCCSSGRSSASRCSTAGCSWPGTPRTPCRRPGRRGSTWRWPTCTCSTGRWGRTTRPRTPGCSSPTPRTALRRVWRAQWFSFWMTSMLHRFSDASDFDLRRQVAELELVTSSPTAAKTLADNYTGLPLV